MCVVCAWIFACISKKNNTERIKQETSGNYLWGSEKKEKQEQDRRKKVEKQVEMYTFICTCFLIFWKFSSPQENLKTGQWITIEPLPSFNNCYLWPDLLYVSFLYIHIYMFFVGVFCLFGFLQDNLKLKFRCHDVSSLILQHISPNQDNLSLILTSYYHN